MYQILLLDMKLLKWNKYCDQYNKDESSQLLPHSRFLVPRDSLSRIVTGQINWTSAETAARRQLMR